MKNQLPIVLAVCLAFAGGFTIAPHSDKGGGDSGLSAQDVRTTGMEALNTPDSGGEGPLAVPSPPPESPKFPSGVTVEPSCDPVPVTPSISLRDAIAAYRRSGGVKYYVSGKTDAQHLVQDHGWSYEQIRGLTVDEQQDLHGATHTGKIDPRNFLGGKTPAAAASDVAAGKPRIRIVSPATWDCPHCPGHRNQDWSGFDVEFVRDNNREKFPCTEWTDSRGVIRRLYGQRKPSQVLWSYRRTMED